MISRDLEDSILDLLASFATSPQNPAHVAFNTMRIYRCHPGWGANQVHEAILLLVSEGSIEWADYPDDKPPEGGGGFTHGLRITKSGLRFVKRPGAWDALGPAL